jgi:hypothetical protein
MAEPNSSHDTVNLTNGIRINNPQERESTLTPVECSASITPFQISEYLDVRWSSSAWTQPERSKFSTTFVPRVNWRSRTPRISLQVDPCLDALLLAEED